MKFSILKIRTCFLSSFRRAISAAFSSLVIPAVLGGAGEAPLFCVVGLALPLSDGVGERAYDESLLVGGGE